MRAVYLALAWLGVCGICCGGTESTIVGLTRGATASLSLRLDVNGESLPGGISGPARFRGEFRQIDGTTHSVTVEALDWTISRAGGHDSVGWEMHGSSGYIDVGDVTLGLHPGNIGRQFRVSLEDAQGNTLWGDWLSVPLPEEESFGIGSIRVPEISGTSINGLYWLPVNYGPVVAFDGLVGGKPLVVTVDTTAQPGAVVPSTGTYYPVPEPSTWLLALVLASLVVYVRSIGKRHSVSEAFPIPHHVTSR